jgi:TPP-dependent pyruvate/acetoin dehydrogenase alpha subunit
MRGVVNPKFHRLHTFPVRTLSLNEAKTAEIYRIMVRIRTFENAVRRLTKEGKIPARFGLYTGQEAVAAGVSIHLRKGDQIGSTHRALGHLIAKGCDLNKLMAELMGKESGFNHGKAGPYHTFDPSVGALGANGIVGGSVPMTAGYALANQLKGEGNITVSYFGEGGSNQGGVQETLNLAACWQLPIVFVCENSSPEVQRMLGHEIDYPQLSIDKISLRAKNYGMPGSTHTGWDATDVYNAAGKAIMRARIGKGPTLLEFKVHQLEGNLEGRLEANEKERQWDPIDLLKQKIPQKLDEQIKSDEAAKIQIAIDFGLRSPEPSSDQAYSCVFKEAD